MLVCPKIFLASRNLHWHMAPCQLTRVWLRQVGGDYARRWYACLQDQCFLYCRKVLAQRPWWPHSKACPAGLPSNPGLSCPA